MSKKALLVILVLSVVVTYIIAILDVWINKSKNIAGLPLGFSSLGSFLGGSTDYLMLVFDIVFWFVVIWGIWKLFNLIFKR
ncbi:hypothetical protein HYT18_03375 [Candidatus Microgenomates bacterium]|nr:hypothetical protein [Candidatus Microgenomates bacterium]